MAIIKQYHADTDTTYVYESTSYWDAEKKQSRSRRKLLGKLDPVTGEIVPTGTRGRKKKGAAEAGSALSGTAGSVSAEAEARIRELTLELSLKDSRIAELEKENRKLTDDIISIRRGLESCLRMCPALSE